MGRLVYSKPLISINRVKAFGFSKRKTDIMRLVPIDYLRKPLNRRNASTSNMETVTIPKSEFEEMKREIKTFRNSKLYRRLIECEDNIKSGKVYTREDLGF